MRARSKLSPSLPWRWSLLPSLLLLLSMRSSAFCPRHNTCTRTPLDAVHELRAGSKDDSTATTKSKYILVTGANKGIGKAICQKLLEEYDDVSVFLCSRNVQRGQQAVQDIQRQVPCDDRLILIPMDTSSDASVQEAVGLVQQYTDSLYGIVNNAGILAPNDISLSTNVNYFGPRRVTDAFLPMLQQQSGGGRIVNIASASGPVFVDRCPDPVLRQKLSQPWTIQGGIDELDALVSDTRNGYGDGYGFSKALVSTYTWLLAKQLKRDNQQILVNAVTPGWINTDMTVGQGSNNPPSKGAIPPVWLLLSDEVAMQDVPSGRYYGSDCKRSPLDRYRGPGDPVYEGPDDG